MAISQAQKNKAAAVKALSQYGKDPSAVIDLASDKVLWIQTAPRGFYPFAGVQRGKKAVIAAMGKIAGSYKFISYKVTDAVAEGNKVWTRSDVHVLAMPSGKPLKFATVGLWTLQRGKLVRYEEFFDTASTLLQEGRIKPDRKKYRTAPVGFRH